MEKKNMPSYSVLMSVYFKENPNYLEQAISSIINQTVATDDFVLVCDGELTKELEDVIKKYPYLSIVRLPRNVGLGEALSVGIKQCKHELVARMDSDDISCLDRCENQLCEFVKDTTLDIISGTVLEFSDSREKVIGKRCLPKEHKDIIKYSKKRCPFNHPAVMVKKSAVEDAGGYNGNFRLEDYYLWIRMLQNGCNAANLEKPLLYMRSSPNMYTRRGGKAYAKEVLIFHWWLHSIGWSSVWTYCTSAIPHALICIMPNQMRSFIYRRLHK